MSIPLKLTELVSYIEGFAKCKETLLPKLSKFL